MKWCGAGVGVEEDHLRILLAEADVRDHSDCGVLIDRRLPSTAVVTEVDRDVDDPSPEEMAVQWLPSPAHLPVSHSPAV